MIRRRRRRRRIIGHAMRCPAAEAEWSACDDAAPRTPRAKRVGAGGISSIIIIARCNSHATVAVLCSTHTDPLPADSIACRSYRETRRFVAPLSLAHLPNTKGILRIFISPQTLFSTTNDKLKWEDMCLHECSNIYNLTNSQFSDFLDRARSKLY